MEEFWNLRYKKEEYVYGIQPNQFFKEVLDFLGPKGNILLPGEGEGRNAIYAAKMGFEVYAFDISEEGRKKAEKLAKLENVKINYEVGDFLNLELINNKYDVVALIYAHFSPKVSSEYYNKIAELIKPNGVLIIEGFSKNHINMQKTNSSIGGPNNIEKLLSKAQLTEAFSDFETIELEELEIELKEGKYHNGKGCVIRFIGRKM